MRQRINTDDFAQAIAEPRIFPRSGSAFAIAESPRPFVAPPLSIEAEESPSDLFAEVILIEASAAVGKSTFAAHLSSTRSAPLLDLAKVHVSTGTLAGLLSSDFPNAHEARLAFHAGKLPILIDALDEGLIHSGEPHVEDFLRTVFEFVLDDRHETARPKLVFLGRPESSKLAAAAAEVYGPGVTTRSLELGFFDEASARELIDAYALSEASDDSPYRSNATPVRDLIDSYFAAIEAALGLARGTLWTDEIGQAFAGYAPVLAALGTLLSKVTNFIEVTNRLRTVGNREAWDVIGSVVSEILEREQREKFQPAFEGRAKKPAPEEAYDSREQLRCKRLLGDVLYPRVRAL